MESQKEDEESYYSYYGESEDNEGKREHHSIHEYEQLTISQPNGLRIVGCLKEAKNQRYKNDSQHIESSSEIDEEDEIFYQLHHQSIDNQDEKRLPLDQIEN